MKQASVPSAFIAAVTGNVYQHTTKNWDLSIYFKQSAIKPYQVKSQAFPHRLYFC